MRISQKIVLCHLQYFQYCLTMTATENNHCELASKANGNTAARFEMFHGESFNALKKRRIFISVIIFHQSALSSYKITKYKVVNDEHYTMILKIINSFDIRQQTFQIYAYFNCYSSIAEKFTVCFGLQLITFSITQCCFQYNLINSFNFPNTSSR